MEAKKAYNTWASQYDTNDNKTRDLEARALRDLLTDIPFEIVLEIGCGTGKNTEWLAAKAKTVTAVDFSDEMLSKAREKIISQNVQFIQADITFQWTFIDRRYDLVSFSLVLEHIHDLGHIFAETSRALNKGGHVYIGELHPYKQYSGSKARFEIEEGLQVVECFNHNISEFIQAAKKNGLVLAGLDEFFDGDEGTEIPRILTLLFRKD
ncbi:MAG: class I SAM-dependent methyltransferase [Ginsengibacter sp.]